MLSPETEVVAVLVVALVQARVEACRRRRRSGDFFNEGSCL